MSGIDPIHRALQILRHGALTKPVLETHWRTRDGRIVVRPTLRELERRHYVVIERAPRKLIAKLSARGKRAAATVIKEFGL